LFILICIYIFLLGLSTIADNFSSITGFLGFYTCLFVVTIYLPAFGFCLAVFAMALCDLRKAKRN